MHDEARELNSSADARRLGRCHRGGCKRRFAAQRAGGAGRGKGIQAHLLGRPDLLRRGEQAAGRHDQQVGRRQRRRDRGRDDQPERDRAKGLRRGGFRHDARRTRLSASTCCCFCRGRTQFVRVDDLYKEIGDGAGRLVRARWTRRPTRRPSPAAARASRSASPATCCCAATMSSRAGRIRTPPRRPGTNSSRRPQRSTSRRCSASAWRSPTSATATCRFPCCSPIGGRIADDAGKTVTIKSDETRDLPAVGQERLGQGPVSAGQHDVGRRRRQPGLSRRPGGLHRQYRLGRHRREEAGSGTLQGHALLVAAGRSEGGDLADRSAGCA